MQMLNPPGLHPGTRICRVPRSPGPCVSPGHEGTAQRQQHRGQVGTVLLLWRKPRIHRSVLFEGWLKKAKGWISVGAQPHGKENMRTNPNQVMDPKEKPSKH